MQVSCQKIEGLLQESRVRLFNFLDDYIKNENEKNLFHRFKSFNCSFFLSSPINELSKDYEVYLIFNENKSIKN